MRSGSEAAEILSFGGGDYATPGGMVKAWMASPEHRHIILLPELRFVGFGVATGRYHGENDVALATADFSSNDHGAGAGTASARAAARDAVESADRASAQRTIRPTAYPATAFSRGPTTMLSATA